MPRHIGIVAVSPEGSAICYRLISSNAAATASGGRVPAVTLHNLPFSDYMASIRAGDWTTIGAMLRDSAQALARAGAEFCVLPDNVAHHALHLAQPSSPIPWLSMIDTVAEAVTADHRRVVGLLGTKFVTYGSSYQTALGLRGVTTLAPDEEDADAVDRIIFDELVHGRCKAESRDRVMRSVGALAQRGCEAVIVGCTELPLVFNLGPVSMPMYDSVDLLALRAVTESFRE